MKPTFRHARVLVIVVALAAILAACGSSKSGGTTLNGSGSTFQKTFDDATISQFHSADPKITVNYAGGGSGQGKTDLQTKTVDFAGTDSIPKPADLPKYQGGQILYFPTVAAPITVSYNLSGVTSLRLSGPTLTKIFALKITKWNDAAIKKDNPGAKLPTTTITVVHRADGSGTTSNFTKFLGAVDPTDWTLGSADTVNWPSNTQAGTGNPGVAQIISQTSGAIGYVDLADAKKANLTFASIQNSTGAFVEPTLAGAAAAVEGSTIAPDLTYSPINAGGAASYPITSPTWIMVYAKQTNKAKATALESFLSYIYSTGEGLAAANNYSALPASVVAQAKAQLTKIQIPS